MPYPGMLHPEPLPLWQTTVTRTSVGDIQTLKGTSGSVSEGSPGMYKVLFEPSEHLWWVWGLILNTTSRLLPSCWVFSFTLGRGVSKSLQRFTATAPVPKSRRGVSPHSHSSAAQLLLQHHKY